MANIQEICDNLKTILKVLNNRQTTEVSVNQINEKVFNSFESDLRVKQIYETIETNLNDLKQTKNSFEMNVCLDPMIKSIILLNNFNESELISTQNLFTIKLTLIKLISLTIIPYISEHFQQIQHLFLSIDGNNSFTHFDNQFICRQFVHKLTKILINFLTTKSIISHILIEDCFASLIASLMTIRHNSDSEEEKQLIAEELNQLISGLDPIVVIRNLLLLSRCKAIKWSNNEISKYLSLCLTKNSGLISLINAVLDCDQTSERQTTLNQRFLAIGTIVSAMPQLCCSLRQYYEIIGKQLFDLLVSSDPNYPRIGSMILICLDNRNKKLTQEIFINKLLNLFLIPNKSSSLSLNNGIEIINNLIINRFDSKKFIPIISHLFYCRVIIDETLSHYKTILNDIIIEIINSIKESVYLMDNILYNNYHLINVFEI